MKKKILNVILFVFFAIPIPIALLGAFMSFAWLINAGTDGRSFAEIVTAFFGVIVGGAYIFTYIFSLTHTIKNKITKKSFLPLVHCIVALLYILSLKPISGYIDNNEEHFGFAKRDFKVVEELDTHGGFLGDGSYHLILDCSDNKEKALEIVQNWNSLPLPENLNLAMFGGENGYNFSREANMPNITNGYYIFEDRHSESSDSTDDSELLERYSLNFSIAVYDCDTNKFYLYELDT